MTNTILTDAGINALVNAHQTGTLLKPVEFVFSADDIDLSPLLIDLTGWVRKDISQLSIVQNNNVELTCIVEQEEAIDTVRSVGIFLEDGTLFCVSKINGIGSNIRQTVKVQIDYENVDGLMDFIYIPSDFYGLQLAIMDVSMTLGVQEMKNAEHIGLLKNKIKD